MMIMIAISFVGWANEGSQRFCVALNHRFELDTHFFVTMRPVESNNIGCEYQLLDHYGVYVNIWIAVNDEIFREQSGMDMKIEDEWGPSKEDQNIALTKETERVTRLEHLLAY